MHKAVDLSIIIVNFNTKQLVTECLKSIAGSNLDTMNTETIVVDNGSTDGSIQAIQNLKFPASPAPTTGKAGLHGASKILNRRLIQNKTNLGYAAANNLGIKNSQGRYILLLNSDTEVGKESLIQMLKFMDDHPDIAAAGARLELVTGEMDPACHRGFPTPWAAFTYYSGLEKLFPKTRIFGVYHQGYKDLHVPHEIDSPSGAFFMVRREALERVGLLDEKFFMYGEDLDWAYRMKEAGFSVWFNPGVKVLHRKKLSGLKSGDPRLRKNTKKYFFEAMRLFYRKHYGKKYGWLVTGLVLLAIKIRSLL